MSGRRRRLSRVINEFARALFSAGLLVSRGRFADETVACRISESQRH
jgi:hypothetical protein